MKAVRFTMTVEHRFIHDKDEAVTPHNDVATTSAREVARAEIPETDLVGAVWKVPEGAEMSVPDKCAAKLIALGYAELLADAPVAPAAAA
ncbi:MULTISPECIES: hypothetical protein [unclassified Methylobacterium]|uniref:hypothetical protein n=1 Tax=unclassified Methylobacterium TaxID=2615210 RepID=UPI00226AB969|nr:MULTISPECIES: hypothetical protein [unclassified Methylobacterium]